MTKDETSRPIVPQEPHGDVQPEVDSQVEQPLPATAGRARNVVLSALTSKDQLELRLTTFGDDTTDFMSNSELHAFFVKDQDVCSYLDQYHEATADIWEEDLSLRGPSMDPGESAANLALLVEQVRHMSPDTRVLLTVKKKVPMQVGAQFRRLVDRLAIRLGLADADRKSISDVAELHVQARFRHRDHGQHSSRGFADIAARLVHQVHEQPDLLDVLRCMYKNLGRSSQDAPTSACRGGNILTIVDLFCDRYRPDEPLTRRLVNTVGRELGLLIDKLFFRDVVESFVSSLEEDLPARAVEEHNRVLIYTDLTEKMFSLEARLRNEGFHVTTTDTLAECRQLARRRHPDLIILRIQALPQEVIKSIHYLLSNGVDLANIPSYVLVNGNVIDRLTGLLAMGVEDIMDVHGSLDPLMLKLKKSRARLEEITRRTTTPSPKGSGSTGHLSDMNLIDLLQAMGPGQRTARITVSPAEGASAWFQLCLNKGVIVYAELGGRTGVEAIYRAIAWNSGTWAIEQLDESELPEPNVDVSNDAILMEGCRLLDESRRETEPQDT